MLKKTRTIIGIVAACLALIFTVWLILLMLGYPLDIQVLAKKIPFAEYIRLVAELTITALLIAALAFL